ncbi:MAG: hypothetical protein J6V53_00125 [Alphaproteobacteria bacterium]|nr:hypothetical protein [Alphaproteobacteria bacterium]
MTTYKHKHKLLKKKAIKDNNNGYRTDIQSECARIKQISDTVLWIDWMDSRWPSEEFKKNKKGEFEFVRELKENEKF